LSDIPAELAASIKEKRRVVIIEEHYGACGLGEALSYLFVKSGAVPDALECLCAAGYPSGRYGSQRFHQEESGLAGKSLVSRLELFLRG
ncbi:MAG: transketolase, partial [Polyangiaceae bacterium]